MLPVSADDDVIQLYTSGRTGHPKGVQLTSANYLSVFEYVPKYGLGYTPDDTVLVAMPLFHVAGVNMGIFALAQRRARHHPLETSIRSRSCAAGRSRR
jgi:acyl-CoA synthetase (AMP-forming)/AMP-acid ligase II